MVLNIAPSATKKTMKVWAIALTEIEAAKEQHIWSRIWNLEPSISESVKDKVKSLH